MSSLSWADRDRAGSLGSHRLNSLVFREVEEGRRRKVERVGTRMRIRMGLRAELV
jgi:hypothetical protein